MASACLWELMLEESSVGGMLFQVASYLSCARDSLLKV